MTTFTVKLDNAGTLTDVTSYVTKLTYDEERTRKATIIKVSFARNCPVTPTNGMEIKLYFDSVLWVGGYLDRVDIHKDYDCLGYGYNIVLTWREAAEVYDNQTIDAIVSDLITKYTDFATTGIQTTTTTLTQFKLNYVQLKTAIKKLSDTLNWQYYTDENKVFYFEEKGYTDSGKTLTVGTNCLRVGKWTYDSTRLQNNLRVFGGRREFGNEETFTGDGVTTEFTLSYKPISNVVVTDAGTRLKGGIDDFSSGVQFTVDVQNRKIICKTAPANNDSVVIDYNYSVPAVVEGDNPSSVASYQQRDKTIFREELQSRDDVINYWDKSMSERSAPSTSGLLRTKEVLHSAQLVNIVDSKSGINDSFVIRSVRFTYPHFMFDIRVGSKEFSEVDWTENLDSRVAELERSEKGNTDVITKLVRAEDTISHSEAVRYYTRNPLDSFALGRALLGTQHRFEYSSRQSGSHGLDEGTVTNVLTTGDKLELDDASLNSGTWVSPLLNYSDSKTQTNIDSFNDNVTNWAVGSDDTGSVALDSTYEQQGGNCAKWVISSSPTTTEELIGTFSKDFSTEDGLKFYFQTTDATKPHYVEISDGTNAASIDFSSQLSNNAMPEVSVAFADFSNISAVDMSAITQIRYYLNGSDWAGGEAFYVDLLRSYDSKANTYRNLEWTESLPANTDVTFDILDSADTALITGITTSPYDLSSSTALTDIPIKIRCNLTNTDGSSTPTVTNIKLGFKPFQLGNHATTYTEAYTSGTW